MLMSKKIKNLQLRQIFNKVEKFKKLNKFIFIYLINKNFQNNIFNKNLIHFFNTSKKFKMKTLMSITRRCLLTNRSRAVYRPFGLSRLVLRDLIQFGSLPGYTKAVW
jgi:ribosomal protein S14